MIFHLRVPGDGANKSVCCTHDIEFDPMSQGPVPAQDPKEFEIIPAEGVIPPLSEIKVNNCYIKIKKLDCLHLSFYLISL